MSLSTSIEDYVDLKEAPVKRPIIIIAALLFSAIAANAFDPEAQRDYMRAIQAWGDAFKSFHDDYAKMMWAYECNVLPHNNRGAEINRLISPKIRALYKASQDVDSVSNFTRQDQLFTFNFQQKIVDEAGREGQERAYSTSGCRFCGCDYWKQHPDEAAALRKQIMDAWIKN